MKKKIIVNKWDTILIKWIDAVSTAGWQQLSGFYNIGYNVNTVGMFVGEDDINWTVCSNHGWDTGTIGNIMSVPKGMITYVEVLKRAEAV